MDECEEIFACVIQRDCGFIVGLAVLPGLIGVAVIYMDYFFSVNIILGNTELGSILYEGCVFTEHDLTEIHTLLGSFDDLTLIGVFIGI